MFFGDCILFLVTLFNTYFKTVILQALLVAVQPTHINFSPFIPVHCYLYFSHFISCLTILILISTFLCLITYFVILCEGPT